MHRKRGEDGILQAADFHYVSLIVVSGCGAEKDPRDADPVERERDGKDGEHATEENDYCFDYLPRLTADHSSYATVIQQVDRGGGGYFLVGENPAVGSANAKLQRLGMANLDWLVVRDFSLIESATFWKDGPEIETGELKTEDIGTEVFFMPAAAHTEKSGSFTNTQRLLQWHHQAIEPAGDARSELWFMYHLGRKLREKLARSTDEEKQDQLRRLRDFQARHAAERPAMLDRLRQTAIEGGNLFAVLIVLALTWLLVIGVKESTRFNTIMVATKLVILVFFIAVGLRFFSPHNWVPLGSVSTWQGFAPLTA